MKLIHCYYPQENIRRRHNYLPFIVEMLKALGDQGKLLPIYEKAKEKAVELDKKNKEKKAVKS